MPRMGNLIGLPIAGAALLTALSAQTLTALTSFDNYNDAKPGDARLIQGLDGNIYGTTQGGVDFVGGWGYGTIYRMTPDGAVTNLYRFGANDPKGAAPNGGLTQVLDGDFYGTRALATTSASAPFFT